MIILFGSAGAGKSVQGHLLAARFSWRWLSAGQLLREKQNPAYIEAMQKGMFVPDSEIRNVVHDALVSANHVDHVILDGFPRQLQQAEWLVDVQDELDRKIEAVIVLDVSKEVIQHRLSIRGRADDTIDAIDQRLDLYRQETVPILEYFQAKNIEINHIDGEGTVGQVHDAIVRVLRSRGVVDAEG